MIHFNYGSQPTSGGLSLLAEMLAKLFGEFTDRGQASSQATGYET